MKTTKYLWLCVVLALSAAAITRLSAEVDVAALRQKLPEKIEPLTPEQLVSSVPSFYYFDYPFQPQPGKRLWIRVTNELWLERYPNGQESIFQVLGHTTVEGTEGTIVVKVTGSEDATGTVNDGGLQAFIPDRGSKLMHHWYRNTERGDTKWNDLGEMKDVH